MKSLIIIAVLLIGVVLAGCIGSTQGTGPSQQSPSPKIEYNQTNVESAVNNTDINSTDEMGELNEESPF